MNKADDEGSIKPSNPLGRLTTGKGSRRPSALFVGALFFIIYNANFRVIHTTDSVPASLVPFSLLIDHSFHLDRWLEPYLFNAGRKNHAYYVTIRGGHMMSIYPPALPVLITPLYIPAAWWLCHTNPRIRPGDVDFSAVANLMEKFSASLIAALSVAFLYMALGRVLSPFASLMVAMIYGLASNTWSISAQALWRHGLTELSFAFLLWAILPRSETISPQDSQLGFPSQQSCWHGPCTAIMAGTALAIAAANKPLDALFAVALAPYFLAAQRRSSLAWFLGPLVLVGSLVLTYNQLYFGRWLGGYPNPLVGVISGEVRTVYHSSIFEGTAGLLASPSRGLLLFMPWTLFSFWGGVLAWKRNDYGWARWLISAMIVVFLVQAKLGQWWGGLCFGPRYLTDLLPFMALLMARVWSDVKRSRILRSCLVVTVVFALGVQIIGVYYFPGGDWYDKPVSVERDSRRLWDWRDNEFRRAWEAGPAKPELLYSAYLLFANSKESKAVPRLN